MKMVLELRCEKCSMLVDLWYKRIFIISLCFTIMEQMIGGLLEQKMVGMYLELVQKTT